MTAKDVLITGATSGLGRNTALALAKRGCGIIVGGRRADAVHDTCNEVRALGVSARPFLADLADLSSVRAALETLEGVGLHAIVANAGMTSMNDARSADGFELTFAVNVLAHQLILRRLIDRVEDGGRIVVLASGVHEPDHKLARRTGVPPPRWVGTHALARPDEAPPADRIVDGRQRYSTSKLGNVLQARALQCHVREQGRDIDVFAVDPGLMVDTELARELPGPLKAIFRGIGRLLTPFVDNMRLSTVSAAHVASLTADERWHGKGFAYLDGDRIKPPSNDALRNDLMDDLWCGSAALIGLESDAIHALPA